MDDKVKELLNKIKETATIAADAAESAARQVGQKTGDTLEMAKLNMKIFDLNTEIGLSMREIGTIVYDTHTGKVTDENALSEIIKSVDEKNAEIESYRAKLAEFKKSVICPVCSETCSKGDTFCKKCGAKLDK